MTNLSRPLQVLAANITHGPLADRLGDDAPAVAAWLRQQAQALAASTTVFELRHDGSLAVDGHVLPRVGRGLVLAWLVLGGQQAGIGPLQAVHVADWGQAKRPDREALAALRRAADAVEPLSLPLAAAIRSIRVRRGALVLDRPFRGVRCPLDDRLAEIFQGMTAL